MFSGNVLHPLHINNIVYILYFVEMLWPHDDRFFIMAVLGSMRSNTDDAQSYAVQVSDTTGDAIKPSVGYKK